MRFLFSVLRFVPDPVRGEFINIGVIVGSDEANDWRLRIVDNYSRATRIDESGMLPSVIHFLTGISSEIDDYLISMESMFSPEKEINSRWLRRLQEISRNILQLSPPSPLIAETIDEATTLVFDEFIVEPERRRFPFKKKTEAMSALRWAFTGAGLVKGRDFFERLEIRGKNHRENFDFAVSRKKIVQLSQAWSFQLPNSRQLAEDIKAWAWTVQDIRGGGGSALSGGDEILVEPDVDIIATFIPPIAGQSDQVFVEALYAFDQIKVKTIKVEEVNQVSQQAVALLG